MNKAQRLEKKQAARHTRWMRQVLVWEAGRAEMQYDPTESMQWVVRDFSCDDIRIPRSLRKYVSDGPRADTHFGDLK